MKHRESKFTEPEPAFMSISSLEQNLGFHPAHMSNWRVIRFSRGKESEILSDRRKSICETLEARKRRKTDKRSVNPQSHIKNMNLNAMGRLNENKFVM